MIEIIPKSVANSTDNIAFSILPQILQEDPVIMWHLDELEEDEITYDVEPGNDVTGKTIFIYEKADNFENTLKILLPILLIPFIVVIVAYFSKFNPRNKK